MSSDTLYAETLNMACIQLITESLRLKLTVNSNFTSKFSSPFYTPTWQESGGGGGGGGGVYSI